MFEILLHVESGNLSMNAFVYEYGSAYVRPSEPFLVKVKSEIAFDLYFLVRFDLDHGSLPPGAGV